MDWNQTFNAVLTAVINWATTAGLRLLIGLIVLFISFRIINLIARRIERAGERGKLDKTLARVFSYVFRIALKLTVAVCIVGYVGIDTSGLAALVTSLGVCIGLAVNGALSNLAGGVLIIMTRPFRVDDFIEAQGYSGTVEDIHITYTVLRTPDNKTVYLPNGGLSAATVVNYSRKDTRRVDITFSISYSADFEAAKALVAEICAAHELVLSDPAPMVRVSAHGASSIDLVTRVWVKSADYWTVNFDLLERVKAAFDERGIEIPFPQMDVHVKQN